MRKLAAIIVLTVMMIFSACSSAPSNQNTSNAESSKSSQSNTESSMESESMSSGSSESSEVSGSEDSIYGIVFLGYAQNYEGLPYENYLSDEQKAELTISLYEGDEFYLIVPTSDLWSMKIHELNSDSISSDKGDVIHEVDSGGSVLLRCNVSDIHANVVVYMENGDNSISFSPSVNQKDNSVNISQGGYLLEPVNSEQSDGKVDYEKMLINTVGDEYLLGKTLLRSDDEYIYDRLCAVFAVGVDTAEKFTVDEWLAVSDDGAVYWYVVEDDNWLGWSTQN